MPNDFSTRDVSNIENTTREVGRYIFDHLSHKQPTVLQRRWWDDRIMAWAMQDESVKVQMFRFIDVLPMLHSSESLTRHLQEYFEEVRQQLPSAVRLGVAAATPGSLWGRALAIAARRNAMGHARRFIAGSTREEVLAAAMRQRKLKRAFTIDLLGEAVTSEMEADRYLAAYLDLIRGLAPIVNAWPEVPQIDCGVGRPIPRVNVSVKLSALDSQFDAINPVGTAARVGARLRELLRAAREHGAFVNVDMESYQTKDLTLAIFQQILSEDEFRRNQDVGIVIQAYLKDSESDLLVLRDWAQQRGTPVWVRLVKGAYWDYETVHARAVGWPVPVFEQKWQTDANYERLTRLLLRSHQHLQPALGSHNIRSLAHGIAVSRHLGLPTSALELQMLYGMGDQEKQALVDLGYRMRIYMPYGELIPGMAYLVRRLLENTSNDSFLRASFTENQSPEKLLMRPEEGARDRGLGVGKEDEVRENDGRWQSGLPLPLGEGRGEGARVAARSTTDKSTSPPPNPLPEGEGTGGGRLVFRNEPPTDFAVAGNRQAMDDALAEVQRQNGRHYPLEIGGRQVDTAERMDCINPSHYRQVIGSVATGSLEHAQQAVAAAKAALPAWAALGAQRRAGYLRRAAEEIRRRRFELAAWQILECGKPRREADADIAEAIDFCEFYADGAIALESPAGFDVPGEENRFEYLPRGVIAVISPWNFPLAILTGMTVAALATGNTVVMKPAEQSSIIGAKLMEVFRDVDLPPGVLNYLPGKGEIVGAALVEHPDTSVIAFTGSRPVGLAINRRAAEVSAAGSRFVKRVIAEMGGKNAIIVDDDCDLDEAVLAVVKSAFGYQGQKCSACSRAVVLDGVHDAFVQRLVEASRSLAVGPAEDPGTTVGPVIDAESLERIRNYCQLGRTEGREVLAVDVGALADEGYYVSPHIFADVSPTARLAQEEIFGPVLAVIRARNLEEAISIVNDTDYALTGGIFSRSPEHIDRVRRELLVGNLYINRGITGALVGRQPFGGFKMSGIGAKAGGADYLLQFVLPRTVTENTMRRGFAPSASAAIGEVQESAGM